MGCSCNKYLHCGSEAMAIQTGNVTRACFPE